jgi:hypothetical protein
MRIGRTSPTGERGFWAETWDWVRSRSGSGQFVLAVAVGVALTAATAAWYVRGGNKVTEDMVDTLGAPVKDVLDEIIAWNDLPTLIFDIGFEEFQAMAQLREEALEEGILLQGDEDWQSAEIRFEGETIPVRIRLKGDWVDHLEEDKWSFRVETRGDRALMGMRSFSVQAPYTRRYLDEWLYMEDLRNAGILAPRYSFVNVVVNGDRWGIYALEESFSKELLESQSRRAGIIVRYDETLFWTRRAPVYEPGEDWRIALDPIATTFELPGFAAVDEFDSTRVQEDPVLREETAAALALLRGFQNGQLEPSQAFDPALTGQYLAHTNLWGARHGLMWHNERFYYNPLTSRLEPIGYDALPLEPLYTPFIDLAQYEDLEIMEAYAREVERIVEPQYLEELRTAYEEPFRRYAAVLGREFPVEYLQPPWDTLAERQALLREALHPPQAVHAYQASGPSGDALTIEVGNLLRYPVRLHYLQVGEQRVDIQADWVAEDDRELLHGEAAPSPVLRAAAGDVPRYVTLQIPDRVARSLVPAGMNVYTATTAAMGVLQIAASLVGVDEPMLAEVQRDYPPAAQETLLPRQPTVQEALERYPFLAASDQPGFLELRGGTWQVDGDLALPAGYGLWGTEETTLLFERDAVLYATGPLLLRAPDAGATGAQSGWIRFLPVHDLWSGIFVLQAGDETASTLHNVEVRGTTGIARGGWMATGGVTFYESPVVLDHSRLLGSAAEDTINVVRARFAFRDSEFGDAASDAFDGDFAEGRIEGCAFHDVRGDAIDVSGSKVTVDEVSFLRVYDKGVSAGESSIVGVTGARASDVGIAFASKDLSDLTVTDAQIERAWTAGLAAYVKKLEYGVASIRASNVTFGDQSTRTLVQEGSRVTIDGAAIAGSKLDVDALYRRQDARAAMTNVGYRFGSSMELKGYHVLTSTLRPGDNLGLVLYWQALATVDQDYIVSVHLLDGTGNVVAQADAMPREEGLPTSQWQVGPLIDDPHVVSLPAGTATGEYRIVVELHDGKSGERAPIEGLDGEGVPDAALILDQTLQVQ